ncbi:hypothetical protein Psi02_76150 [Planotetraspora silvatica]|uniref:Uncharacterized protein n=1 Tax=Planotetraspora silvatica TaxID=234614 RepID=A0A8J3UUX7_9ACTN|nr:hypothetical protein Psi02_76150 [Planotetraspora silvatica]
MGRVRPGGDRADREFRQHGYVDQSGVVAFNESQMRVQAIEVLGDEEAERIDVSTSWTASTSRSIRVIRSAISF